MKLQVGKKDVCIKHLDREKKKLENNKQFNFMKRYLNSKIIFLLKKKKLTRIGIVFNEKYRANQLARRITRESISYCNSNNENTRVKEMQLRYAGFALSFTLLVFFVALLNMITAFKGKFS